MKILIFATHPIQYQVPIYKELSKNLDLKVIYLLKQTKQGQADAGFGVEFEWDIPLLEGYQCEYLTNLSEKPSSSTYNGIILDKKELVLLFEKEKPNAVIINGWFPKGLKQVIDYTYKNNITSFCRGDSTLLMTSNPIKKWLKEIYIRNILRKINYFLYVGTENKKFYQHYGINEKRLYPALHCINTPFFQKQFDKTPISKSNNLISIGFSGKFIKKKQPLLLLEAVRLSKFKNQIQLIFIGDGPLRNEIESFSSENNINIKIKGFLNQSELVEKGYRFLDVLVLPSYQNETWGLVINEVMTGGIPCIVSDKVGCHVDLIEEGITGYTFKSTNTLHLTKKIDEFISTKLNGNDYKSNVLKRISFYSIENTVKAYIEALNHVVKVK